MFSKKKGCHKRPETGTGRGSANARGRETGNGRDNANVRGRGRSTANARGRETGTGRDSANVRGRSSANARGRGTATGGDGTSSIFASVPVAARGRGTARVGEVASASFANIPVAARGWGTARGGGSDGNGLFQGSHGFTSFSTGVGNPRVINTGIKRNSATILEYAYKPTKKPLKWNGRPAITKRELKKAAASRGTQGSSSPQPANKKSY